MPRVEVPRGARRRAVFWLTSAIKLAITVGIFILLFRAVEPAALLRVLARLSWLLVVLAIALQGVVVMVSARRWQWVLRSLGDSTSLTFLAQISLIGAYFGLLAPSGIGADIVRGYYLRRTGVGGGIVVASVLFDRIAGVFVLGLLALPGAGLVVANRFMIVSRVGVLMVLGLAALAVAGAFFLLRPALRALARRVAAAWEGGFANLVCDRTLLSRTVLLSAVAHVVTIGIVTVLGMALGAAVPLVAYLIYFPLVSVLCLAPISLNGLGVRDAAFVVLFGAVGMPLETALSLSLLFFALMVLTAGVGGILYLAGRAGLLSHLPMPAIGSEAD